MADERVHGASLLGEEPKRLELSDGSRLILDGSADADQIEWRRLGRGWTNVSVSEAVNLAAAAASKKAAPSATNAMPGQFDLIPKPAAGLVGSRVLSLGRSGRPLSRPRQIG